MSIYYNSLLACGVPPSQPTKHTLLSQARLQPCKLEVVSDLKLFQTRASQVKGPTGSSWLMRNKPNRFAPAQLY